MTDFSKFKKSIENNKKSAADYSEFSNPLSVKTDMSTLALSDYSQSIQRSAYDKDISGIVEVVRILNNMVPLRMPMYNFNLEEINGESYYLPDGTLLLIREDDSDVIRDYYASSKKSGYVDRILEHDKNTGRLRVKIEPITRKGSRLKANITIFDEKINKKYTLIQLSEGGVVNNVTEFSGKGKSFQTLFRNIQTFKPARYLEGKDSKEYGFEMIDCIFDSSGNVARIKKYNSKREIKIEYTEDKKHITVRNKQS